VVADAPAAAGEDGASVAAGLGVFLTWRGGASQTAFGAATGLVDAAAGAADGGALDAAGARVACWRPARVTAI